jgi:hypothetical protein
LSNFYETKVEIWTGFEPIGNTEKKNWADYEQTFEAVSCFHGQKKFKVNFFKYCS